MKIYWDNIENAKLTKNGLLRINNRSYHIKECSNCNKEFLGRIYSIFCSNKCAQIGQNNSYFSCSNETKEKIKKNLVDFTGKYHTEKSKRKISKKLRGRIISKEWRKKLSESLSGENHPNYGKHLSRETRRKISESNKEKQGAKGNESYRWDGGYHSNNIPKYDTYALKIDWCESVRRNKQDQNILEVKCAYCGKWYKPTLTSVRNRIQILNGNENYDGEHRFYCSNSCKFECPIFGQILWPKGFKISTSREAQPELRQMVLERDNYECQKCGSTEHLHCHHIEGILWEPLESADVDMCITLCKSCHIEVHKLPDCGTSDMRCI